MRAKYGGAASSGDAADQTDGARLLESQARFRRCISRLQSDVFLCADSAERQGGRSGAANRRLERGESYVRCRVRRRTYGRLFIFAHECAAALPNSIIFSQVARAA